MLKNYFKIAFRTLRKNPVYAFINIFGLSVGIACCVLILLFVQNEWSFDTFHNNSDRLYRAWVHEDYGDNEIYFNSVTPLVLAPTLENNIPEVESTARLYNFTNLVRQSGASESFSETITMVGTDFFSMFDFKLIKGEASIVFNNPNSAVLTEETARRLFGDADPMQQVISIQTGETFRDYKITGIAEVPPENSSIRYSILIPFTNSQLLFSENAHTSWFNVVPETYVLLQSGSNVEDVETKLVAMMKDVLGEQYAESNYTVGLQPITDIHLNTEIPRGIAEVSDPTYSYILGAIALLILLIACVNFMTLSISRSTSRAKEVGIRKTIGALRQHLMYQFWGEALLMTLLATGTGIIMAELMLPYFNALSGTELQFSASLNTFLFLRRSSHIYKFGGGYLSCINIIGIQTCGSIKGEVEIVGG